MCNNFNFIQIPSYGFGLTIFDGYRYKGLFDRQYALTRRRRIQIDRRSDGLLNMEDIMKKEVVLVEDLIEAINNLRNCPNGHSDVYDKATLFRLVKGLEVKEIDLE